MNPYIITDKAITNMLAMSTMDRRDLDLFLEVHSYYLTEYIFNCMCHYLYNYRNLEEYDKDAATYIKVYERFNAAGYNEAYEAGTGKFNYTAMSVSIPDNGSFCSLSSSFMDDVYESLECHFGLESDGGQASLTSDTLLQKAQAVIDATAFVIEQIERAVFGKYARGETVFALLSTCEGSLSIQVYIP